MDREEAFEFLDRTARGIAEMFGSTCETLVHDMGDPSHPILSIYNGHVSGRTVGSTLDILGTAKELDEDALVTDFVNLYATTPSGQQIKSSTFHLIGEGYNLALGKPVSALNKRDRMKIIALLDQKNAFSFRKSVPFVAKRLQVSRYTVYKYLGELTGAHAEESEEE